MSHYLNPRDLPENIACSGIDMYAKNHELWFDYHLSDRYQVRIKPWTVGIDWEIWLDHQLIEHREPLDDLGIPLALLIQNPQTADWTQQIPTPLIPTLLAFDSAYPGKTFPLLWYASRYPAVIELLTEPLLVWLILHHATLQQWNQQQILQLFMAKRTQILAACGLNNSKTHLNILKKLRIPRLSTNEYHRLHRCQALPDYEMLRYLPYIDTELLRAIEYFPELTTSAIIRRYPVGWDWKRLRNTLNDIKSMAAQLGCNVDRQIANCTTLNSLDSLHDQLVMELNALEHSEMSQVVFQPPPLPGNQQIVPIRDALDLILESQLQRHCVQTYKNSILKGTYYVYKVFAAEERATLGLRLKPSLGIDQLKLSHNREPSAATQEMVNQWFAQAQSRQAEE